MGKNVALVSQNCRPGLTIFRRDLILELVDQGHKVYAFAIDYTPATREEVVNLGAIPCDYSISKSGLNPLKDIKDIIKLSIKLNRLRLDSVLCFFIKPSLYGSFASFIARVPSRVAVVEGLGYIHTKSNSKRNKRKFFLKLIHGFLCTVFYSFSKHVLFLNKEDIIDLEKFSYINKKKVVLFGPIGLDLSYYTSSIATKPNEFTFTFIGRLIKEKGVFEYIQAAKYVKRLYPETRFLLLGAIDRDNPSALSESELDELLDSDLVEHHGHVNDVREWLKNSHVFVLPSYREGFPRSTQEAMAMGLPIITTDVPGCRDTIVNEKNGVLIPPQNAEALAQAMAWFIRNPLEAKEMGRESLKVASEMFDVKDANSRLIKLLIKE